MLLGLTLVFAVAFAAACDPEIPGCASASAAPTPCNAADPSATSCSTGKCDVTINGKTYCSQCTTGKVPVNGECKTKSDATLCTAGSGSAEGTCTACTGSQKLYKGGCYDKCPYGDGQASNTCADAPVGGSDPNLSTGAIAGISVAVIVVVGGLVGFLCWWFVCRGKA